MKTLIDEIREANEEAEKLQTQSKAAWDKLQRLTNKAWDFINADRRYLLYTCSECQGTGFVNSISCDKTTTTSTSVRCTKCNPAKDLTNPK